MQGWFNQGRKLVEFTAKAHARRAFEVACGIFAPHCSAAQKELLFERWWDSRTEPQEQSAIGAYLEQELATPQVSPLQQAPIQA
jgi:hypothetical protein